MVDRTAVPAPLEQVRRFYEVLWNQADLSVIPELLHPEITFRGSLGETRVGHEQVAEYVRSVTRALGDYRCDIRDLVADEGKAAARMLFTGVHRAPFLGFEPTGRQVSWGGAAFFTFDGHLIRAAWILGDLDSLRDQLAS
ncbi:MAG: ester cyclase [Nocardioidaceae bacterium]